MTATSSYLNQPVRAESEVLALREKERLECPCGYEKRGPAFECVIAEMCAREAVEV